MNSIFKDRENENKYDYVLDCNGLETVPLINIYNEYKTDANSARDKYLNKAFIFEGKIFMIGSSDKNPYIRVDSGSISPTIYINSNESIKLSKYQNGDNIRVCGIVTNFDEFSTPVRVENGSIIE